MKEYLPAPTGATGTAGPKGWEYSSYPASPYQTPHQSLQSLFNDMFFLGFHDQIARWNSLTSLTKPASFPPYNLIKIDDDNYEIEMAVAGYTKDDVEISVEKDLLTVSSKEQTTESEPGVIYQGIARRQWRQKFILGEYMEVSGATLKDGLLTIKVERELPEEAKPKVIKIK